MKQAVKDFLSSASMSGVSSQELKQMKAMLTSGESKLTKKYKTRAERVARRKMQKVSRRINRGIQQGKRPTK